MDFSGFIELSPLTDELYIIIAATFQLCLFFCNICLFIVLMVTMIAMDGTHSIPNFIL